MGLFQGTITAQQIIDNGGIPLTFTSADNLLRLDKAGDPIQLFQVPANYPRRDYDLVTGVCKGLLVEEQRTNLLLWSNDFTNALWIKSGLGVGSAPVLNPTPVAGPDGTLTATRVTLTNTGTTSSDWSWLYTNVSGTSGLTYCASAFIRASTPGDVGKRIRYGLVGTSFELTLTAEWRLLEFSAPCVTTTTYNTGPRLRGTETTDTTVTFDICHAQLEVGAFATSRIPTSSVSTTRATDIPVINTLSPWFNSTEGTFLVEFTHIDNSAADRVVFTLHSTSWVNNALHVRSYSGSIIYANYSGSTSDANLGLGLMQSTNKLAVGYATNDYIASMNGSAVVKDKSVSVPPVTTLCLGGNGTTATTQRNGHISRIQYIPKRLTDSEYQVRST